MISDKFWYVFLYSRYFLSGVYCGTNVPSDLPQAERFWLKFKSTSDGVAGGFLAKYAYGTFLFLIS